MAAADVSGSGSSIANADSGAQGAEEGSGGTTSFQKLMNEAQSADSAEGAKGTQAAKAVAAPATTGPSGDAAAGEMAPAGTAATVLAAGDPLAQLLQLSGQGAVAASTAAGASQFASTVRQEGSDRDADAAPHEDPLALVLASLAHLGITVQPATPAATADAALAVAADGAAAMLGGALPKSMTGVVDSLAARLRPGVAITLPAAANDESGAGMTSATNLLNIQPAAGNISLRDLLDGSGGDAASRARDPVEVTASARPTDGAALHASSSADGSRAAETVTRTISVPVHHPRWAEAVSSQIRWFAEQGVQGATLRLTPEHLGPVEVRLSLAENQVTVNFTAASAETRTALEQSLPRLREMLAGAGLSLGEAQVQQQMRQGSQNQFSTRGETGDTDVRDTLARVPMRLGLVDEYA